MTLLQRIKGWFGAGASDDAFSNADVNFADSTDSSDAQGSDSNDGGSDDGGSDFDFGD